MAKSYPESVPEAWTKHEALESAYRRGWNHGHGIACHNVPELGKKMWIEDMGRTTIDPENVREAHQSLCFSAESNSRDYSPFEFTAKEFNDAGEGDEEGPSAEELWNAFEDGASGAIFADLAEYTDEDYGIEEEKEED